MGLGAEIAKSLRAADPEKGGRRPVDAEGLLDEFEAAIELALAHFEGIDRSDFSFAALAAAQDRLPPDETRDTFARELLTVHHLWEFLDPHPALGARRADYRWLAQVYESVQPTGSSDALLWHRLGTKTLGLVHGHISDLTVTGAGLEEVIVDAEMIEAIRQLALPGADVGSEGPLTLAEALDTIESRLRRRLQSSGATRSTSPCRNGSSACDGRSSARLPRRSSSSGRSLSWPRRQNGPRTRAARERLKLLPDPNVGALTQIFREYAPSGSPVILENVVADIDAIVRQVSFSGWNETQAGDRTVRKEVRLILKKYSLPTAGELFDRGQVQAADATTAAL